MDTAAEVVEGVRDLRGVEALLQRLRDELVEVKSAEQKAIDYGREQYDRAEGALEELARVTADRDAIRAADLANVAELQRADTLIGELRASLASETARANTATLNSNAWQGTAIATMNGDFDALSPAERLRANQIAIVDRVRREEGDPSDSPTSPYYEAPPVLDASVGADGVKIGDCFRWIGGACDGEIGEVTEGPLDVANLQGAIEERWAFVTGSVRKLYPAEILLDESLFTREPNARPARAAASEVREVPVPLSFATPSPDQSTTPRREKKPLNREPRTPARPGPPPSLGLRSSPRVSTASTPRAVQATSDLATLSIKKYLDSRKLAPGRSRMVGGTMLNQAGQRLHACQAVIKALEGKAPEQVTGLAAKARLTAADAAQAVRDLEGAGLLGKAGA